MSELSLPAWVEESRLQDDAMAVAYDLVPAQFRVALKTGLALSEFNFGHQAEISSHNVQRPHSGFWCSTHAHPLPWTIIVFDSTYDAAARLCSAAVLPVLAGVELIAAICVGQPTPQALISLEMCGVEDIFSGDESLPMHVAAELARQCGKSAPGRLVLLHSGQLRPVSVWANEVGIHFYEEWRAPRILVRDPQYFSLDILAFAQGWETLRQAVNRPGKPDAIYAVGPETVEPDSAPLVLSPGCEGFWIHPGLGPDFFRFQAKSFGVLGL